MAFTQAAMGGLAVAVIASSALGQARMAPPFDQDYTITSLGPVPDVPLHLGGVCFLHDDPNVLLVAGQANTLDGAIYAVPVARDADGHIEGFAGAARSFATAPGLQDGGVNGSLSFFPDGSLTYCTSPDNCFGQIRGHAPDFIQDLDETALKAALGAHAWVPCGFPGGRSLKLVTHDPAYWYEGGLFVQQGCGPGCFFVYPETLVTTISGGPRAIEYVSGSNPAFGGEDAVLITKGMDARIDGYRLDDNGNPIAETVFPLVLGLDGAEGMTVDPLTHDLIITTSADDHGGGNEILVIRGFRPCPAGDINGDGTIDAGDLATLLDAWGHCHGCDWCDGANLDCDCEVDAKDLAILLEHWGQCG